MLNLKMWLIVRCQPIWHLWCIRLLTKYMAVDHATRKGYSKHLWTRYNKGFQSELRYTPYQAINAAYFDDMKWEGSDLS